METREEYTINISGITRILDRIDFLQKDDKVFFKRNLDKSKFDLNKFHINPVEYFDVEIIKDYENNIVCYKPKKKLEKFLKLFDIFDY